MRKCILTLVMLFAVGLAVCDAPRQYPAQIESTKQVYDGDTISGVEVNVIDKSTPDGEVWPGIFKRGDSVYVRFSLRVAGIDTPEKRPSKKTPDGRTRTEANRERERQAAHKARQALIDLLTEHDNRLTVINPQIGKYAGRFVCDVLIGATNLATYLIERGHAKPYDGGRKPTWDWEKNE